MKQHRGIWFPDHEEHLMEWIEKVAARPDAEKFMPMRDGKMTYQAHKYMAALKWCRGRGVAVDIGAHVGLWSRVMALDFTDVFSFEPMPDHAACWRRNMLNHANAHLYEIALGERIGKTFIKTRTPGSSGDTGINPVAEKSTLRAGIATDGVPVMMQRLDVYGFDAIDFLKIDCEGYEVFILRGAVETLKRCRPTVIVEQKEETGMESRYGVGPRDAVNYLISLGAKLRTGIQGDYVLSWDK